MKRRTFALLTAVITFTAGVVAAKLSLPNLFKTPPPVITLEIIKEAQAGNYRLTGPYQFDNLKVFLIHGPDTPDSMIYTPLQEAMLRKIARVHEMYNVNELAIENVSTYEEVLVQAGDIVKGGIQDRVMAVDLILPKRSGIVPISAFCVEQSRWQTRGVEPADQFTMTDMAAGSLVRRAIVDVATQAAVWNEVKAAQEQLTVALPKDVRSAESPSSLPLALENDAVRQATAAYLSNLHPVPQRWDDVIGFAVAINDEIKVADVYSSNMMFKRTWYRLLEAAAVEAVATPRPQKTRDALSIETVGSFLTDAEQGEKTVSFVNFRTQSIKRETAGSLFFETRDIVYDGAWVHRSYIRRITD